MVWTVKAEEQHINGLIYLIRKAKYKIKNYIVMNVLYINPRE